MQSRGSCVDLQLAQDRKCGKCSRWEEVGKKAEARLKNQLYLICFVANKSSLIRESSSFARSAMLCCGGLWRVEECERLSCEKVGFMQKVSVRWKNLKEMDH